MKIDDFFLQLLEQTTQHIAVKRWDLVYPEVQLLLMCLQNQRQSDNCPPEVVEQINAFTENWLTCVSMLNDLVDTEEYRVALVKWLKGCLNLPVLNEILLKQVRHKFEFLNQKRMAFRLDENVYARFSDANALSLHERDVVADVIQHHQYGGKIDALIEQSDAPISSLVRIQHVLTVALPYAIYVLTQHPNQTATIDALLKFIQPIEALLTLRLQTEPPLSDLEWRDYLRYTQALSARLDTLLGKAFKNSDELEHRLQMAHQMPHQRIQLQAMGLVIAQFQTQFPGHSWSAEILEILKSLLTTLIENPAATQAPILPPVIQHDVNVLGSLRSVFQSNLSIFSRQKSASEATRALMEQFLQQAIEVLGPPPCQLALLLLGSSSRGDRMPYSDVELALLYQPLNNQPLNPSNQINLNLPTEVYIAHFISLLELQLVFLGESHEQTQGFWLDSSTSLRKYVHLRGSPEWVLKQGIRHKEKHLDESMPNVTRKLHSFLYDPSALSLMMPMLVNESLGGKSLFDQYQTLLNAYLDETTNPTLLHELLQLPKQPIESDVHAKALAPNRHWHPIWIVWDVFRSAEDGMNQDNQTLDIKKTHYKPLAYFGLLLRLYFNLQGEHSTLFTTEASFIEAVDRKLISPELGQWLLQSLEWVLGLRLQLHQRSQKQDETLDLKQLTAEERFRLEQLSGCFVLLEGALLHHIKSCVENPSKGLHFEETIADFIEQRFKQTISQEIAAAEFIQVTRYLLYTHAPLAIHRYIYNRLPRDWRAFCLTKAKAFFQQKDSWWDQRPEFWEQLWDAPDETGHRPSYEEKRRNWEKKLRTLVCNEDQIIEQKVKIYIHSLTLGEYALHPDVTKVLLIQSWITSHGEFAKKDKHPLAKSFPGNHLVIPYPNKANPQFFLKVYPEYPLVELFLHELGRRLGHFTPRFVDVWFWRCGKYDYPVLVSEAVPGPSLQTLLAQQQPLQLNPQAFNEAVVLSALTNLEDNKPDNIIVRTTDHGQQLVWIDADRWFVPAFKENQLHAKDITFCLNDMHKKIDWVWREEFLSLNPEALLSAWVGFLKMQGKYCQMMFEARIEDYFKSKSVTEKTLLLPPLKLSAVTELFTNIQRMQNLVAQQPHLDFFKLLSCIQPRLANHYGRAHQEKLSDALKRFDYVAGHAYLRGKGGNEYYSSKINFKTQQDDMWQSLALSTEKPKDIRASWERDIQLAEKELEEISESPQQLKEVALLIKAGNLQQFEQLSLRGKEKVLATFDWSTLSTEIQRRLLVSIQSVLGWEHLRFDHLPLLTDKELELILEKSPHLKTLQIMHCDMLTGTSIVNSIRMDCSLKELKLIGLTNLLSLGRVNRALILPNLEKLEIADCSELGAVYLDATILSVLSITNTPKLAACRTQSKQLAYLKLTNTDSLPPEAWHMLATDEAYMNSLHTVFIKPCVQQTSSYSELIQPYPFLLQIDFKEYNHFIYPSEIKQCTDVLARYGVDEKALSIEEKQGVTESVTAVWEKIKLLKQKFVKPLLKALRDKNGNVRAAAAGVLVKLGHETPDVVQALLNKLWDRDSNVVRAAADALGELKQANLDVIRALLTALKDTDYTVRAAAAGALGELKQTNSNVIEGLLTALGDKGSSTVSIAATGALVKLGHENPDAISALLAALKDTDYTVRAAAAGALGELKQANSDVIQALLTALGDKGSSTVSIAATGALVKLGHKNPDVIQALLTALRDKEKWYVRAAAARTLGKLKQANPDVIRALLTALGDTDYTVRVAAAGALGELKQANSDVIQALLIALRDKGSDVRAAAAGALAKLGHENPDVIPALLIALRDKGSDVCAAAAGALVKLGHENPDVIPVLLTALRDKGSDVRAVAAGALVKLGHENPDVIPALLIALWDTNYTVCVAAAGALGELKQTNPNVIPALLTALRNKDSDVRAAAAGALVKLGHENPDVIPALLTALRDKGSDVRAVAAGVLVKLGHETPKVIQALLTALRDKDSDVRAAAASVLVKLGHENLDVIPALLTTLKNKYGDRDVRAVAAGALGELKQANSDVIEGLLAALRDAEWQVCTAATGALLVKLGYENPDVIQALLTALKDKADTVRTNAAHSLGLLIASSFQQFFAEFDNHVSVVANVVCQRETHEREYQARLSIGTHPRRFFNQAKLLVTYSNHPRDKDSLSDDEEIEVILAGPKRKY